MTSKNKPLSSSQICDNCGFPEEYHKIRRNVFGNFICPSFRPKTGQEEI
jgi:hypothetical protein